MTEIPKLTERQRSLFEAGINTADNGRLCIVSAIEKSTGKQVAVICGVFGVETDGEYFEQLYPWAVMLDGDIDIDKYDVGMPVHETTKEK